ncbi:MAG TPA: DUF2199 domain-containing protein [Longimicrobium sp.]|nr:DUF2199 domain-containing protein [Longimicrobium sp.]
MYSNESASTATARVVSSRGRSDSSARAAATCDGSVPRRSRTYTQAAARGRAGRDAGYPDTLLLKTYVHLQPVPVRPLVELEPTDHPLAVDQREGVTQERAREIVEAVLHGRG